jgi:hypothetical protein
MKLKQRLDKYLKEYSLPRLKEFGLTDISVYGFKSPSETIGQIFIDTTPTTRKIPNQRTKDERYLEYMIQDEIEVGLSLFGENYSDYLISYNKRPSFKLDEEKLPFKEKVNGNTRTRVFSENTKSDELKWHFDNEDRSVKVIQSNNWKIQMDNQMPKSLTEGKEYFIPKGVYHRVIKGDGDLKVEITFR